MPEIIEVEVVARSLARHVLRHKIRRLEIFDPKLAGLDAAPLVGRTIRAVFRAGKEIVFDLSRRNDPLWLCVHLRMTGRLLYRPPKTSSDDRHLRAQLTLDRGSVHFHDSRRFGVMRLCRSRDEWTPAGVDPLSDDFTLARLRELAQGSRTAIKPWLLRQDKIVGFGNIYASEVLFAARIDPRKPVNELSDDERKRLHRQTRRILKLSLKHGGTTIDDFMDCDGECGGFQRFLQVYGRAGEPCAKCGGAIERLVQQGRSTFFCPACQR
ncbi:MAG TPA: bifunctional DNA-formamidopyrimidine glycosylase/DNA-(apurinic or apyrimidinic site) lyase [bacterium]|nr:bifunctional DNA-formamidopyrimidine glycosylase/DNA-(apurinic or apyrimidinic site) lyase [bacterium]